MQTHPLLRGKNVAQNILPSQNASLTKKNTDAWKHENMDVIANIALRQFEAKKELINNYKLANGELVISDFYEGEKNTDILEYMQEELSLPNFLKPYDIITQPYNTLLGEIDNLPDIFRVVGRGDIFDNVKNQVKTQFLHEWFMQEVNMFIGKELENQGYDPDPIFDNEEEQNAYLKKREALSPPGIQKYMDTTYKHIIEIWAQKELEDQFERYKLRTARRSEFSHWLIGGQRFRHMYVSPKGLEVESLNSLFAFSEKSPEIEWVQDGDLAGVVQLLSINSLIDRYGHELTDKDLNSLEEPYKAKPDSASEATDWSGRKINYTSVGGLPYMTPTLTSDPDYNKYSAKVKNFTGLSPFITQEVLERTNGSNSGYSLASGLFVVVKAYWRSQKRIGKLTWINPESGLFEKIIIDESFQAPDYIKHIKNVKFKTEASLNTIVWTKVVEIWEGGIITNYGSNTYLDEPIYFGIQPAELQIGKLLIAGQFCNNINTKSTSLIDRMKPLQFFYTVIMNQSFHQFQTEILPFFIMESGMIAKDKDWGGEEAMIKWLELAQVAGVAPADTSPQNMQGANPGGQLPKIIDLDRGNRVVVRFNLAQQLRQLALEQVGISPQRMGDIGKSETAAGIQQASNGSYTQTGSWFRPFFDCEGDILQMQLDCAKKLQTFEGIQAKYKSELTTKALSMESDLDLYDAHVYLSDSQEEKRKLDLSVRLAVDNNTSNIMMSDRIQMSTLGSATEILENLKASEKEMMQRQQQDQQLKQDQLKQQQEQFEQAQQTVLDENEKDRQTQIEIATIKALGFSSEPDIDDNNISDVIQYRKSLMNNAISEASLALKSDELRMKMSEGKTRQNLEYAKLQEAKDKRIHENNLQKMKIQQTKIQGDKSK